MFERLKEICDSFLDMGVPGFDLNIYYDGQCALRYMNGYSDLKNRIPIKGNELYRIYSCSKPITSTAGLQLWEKGLFKLDDKVADYLPEYANLTVREEDGTVRKAKTPLLVRHLFEMTGGFSYNYNSPKLHELREQTNNMCTTRQVVRALAEEPLLFDPGDQYHYCIGLDVLSAMIEVITGQAFEDYVKEHIFDPLGMTNSTFHLTESEYDRLTCQYRFDKEQGKAVEITKENDRVGKGFVSGSGGCVSTVDDYIKFTEALRLGDIILSKDTIKLMATDRLTPEQKRTFTLKDCGYGLGVSTPPAGGGWRTGFGWGGAAGSFMSVDIPHKLTFFYAQQMLSAPNFKLRRDMSKFILQEFGFLPKE